MKAYSNRNPLVGQLKKAMPLVAAYAFFLCLAAYAQNNEASNSDVYGSNLDRTALTTFNDGSTDLDIFNPLTTSLTLNHEVSGYVNISNSFNTFSISTTAGGLLTSSNHVSLSVFGGTDLIVSGGSFGGSSVNAASNEWTGAIGGRLSSVSHAEIQDAVFTGQSVENGGTVSGGGPPLPGEASVANASGSTALIVENGTYASISDGTLTGGAAGSASSIETNTWAVGGHGLEIYSSSVVLSNTTVSGGAGGSAGAYGNYTSYATGGHAVLATNSTLVIHSGTFNAGAGGSVNGTDDAGGYALYARNGSSVTNYGGTFNAADDLHSAVIENSDMTTYGGTYSGEGLLSITTGSGHNDLYLHGGNFNGLSFINTSNGTQFVSVSNIAVYADVYMEGGTVEVENYDDTAFQTLKIESGTLTFNQDFVLSGDITLNTTESTVHFSGLTVTNGGTLNTGTGSIITSGDARFATGSGLNLSIITNQAGMLQAASVTFETNSSLTVDASLAGLSSGVTNISIISGALSGFDTNLINAEIIVSANTNAESRTTAVFDPSGSGLSIIFDTLKLSDYWNAAGDFAVLANELENLAPTEMNVIINNLGVKQSSALVEETYFTTMNTFQVAKQGLDAAIGLSLSRGTEFRDQLALPKAPNGLRGPGAETPNDWRFWMKYYGNFYSRSPDGLNPEYDATMHGGLIGMDKSFGRLLIGLAGGMGNYKIDAESSAEQTMNAFQGTVYSTIGFGHSFIDAGLAYGFNDVESSTADPLTLESEFDSHLFSAHLGGGIGFELPRAGTVITPETSIRYTTYKQDGYTESGTAAAPRTFDSFDSDSFVGSLGLNAAMLNSTAMETFAFKIEGRAHWLREFNPEPGDLHYQLVGGANDYTIIYPYLDEDTIRLGVGLTFFNTEKASRKNVLLRLDFDELIGEDFNSHNLSAKAIFAF
ncbi:autotransporter domain-containing protein [Verrucomicrobia bacterium S94]|nr:autotransporter domain-containing protein [Verrucomicrobia bacterium S94]